MNDETVTELRQFFAALSDEDRLAIAGALAIGPASAADLAARLDIKPAALVRHLTTLAEAGIARTEQRTGTTAWTLDLDRLRERRKTLLARERLSSPADEPGTPAWERSVLATFFDGERLKDIPASLKKRHVILAWLVNQFDRERRYPERDVNEIIKRHHPDSAELRRALVDYRYMERENGIYWRIDEDHSASEPGSNGSRTVTVLP